MGALLSAHAPCGSSGVDESGDVGVGSYSYGSVDAATGSRGSGGGCAQRSPKTDDQASEQGCGQASGQRCGQDGGCDCPERVAQSGDAEGAALSGARGGAEDGARGGTADGTCAATGDGTACGDGDGGGSEQGTPSGDANGRARGVGTGPTPQSGKAATEAGACASPGTAKSARPGTQNGGRGGKQGGKSSGSKPPKGPEWRSPGLKGAAARVRRGVVVRLHSLQASAELNGAFGLCVGPATSEGRWAVHLDGEDPGCVRNVRKENLQVVACGGVLKGGGAAPAAAAARGKRKQMEEPSRDAVIRGIAELECTELRRCSPDERPALRRRLLLKWHPDKAPGGANRTLATEVTQAMQNLPQWQ
mmetsp:Transcript_95357/g.307762  ORF Transcript_95357/g.307762 Transcript_95357/m.307762 type:complete len:362 (-) Transcript_95357:96-1181(-)